MSTYYICSRGKQCGCKSCNPNCYYTNNFFSSRLWVEQLKPTKPIPFIRDKHGNWWEVNFDWDKNLPESLRSKPEELISYSYDQIVQGEVYMKVKGAKDAFDKQNNIIF